MFSCESSNKTLAMFLIHLPASMRETVGAGDHRTAAAMVKAADALWDARGGHDPLPAQIFTPSKTLAMACANFTIITPIGLTGAFRPVLGQKTNSPLDPFRPGGFSHTRHCHGYAFSRKRWFDFFLLTN